MGVEAAEQLLRYNRIALDSSIYIHALNNSEELPLAAKLLEALPKSKAVAYTSSLTILEVMVYPYRAHQEELIPEHLNFITGNGRITLIDLGRQLAMRVAEIRARYNLKTPDAIQLATAIETDCQVFLTTDKDFQKVTGERLEIIIFPTAKK